MFLVYRNRTWLYNANVKLTVDEKSIKFVGWKADGKMDVAETIILNSMLGWGDCVRLLSTRQCSSDLHKRQVISLTYVAEPTITRWTL
jgi:hypothetical protein